MKNGPAVTNQSLEGSRLRRTNPHRGTQIPCGQPTSMISPCQEGKSSPDALGRSANKVFRSLQLAFAPLDGGSSSIENQTSICCLSPAGPPQKIEFVISCQSRNNSMGASGAYAPSLSRLPTRPGRLRAEENLLISPPSMRRCSFLFLLPESLFGGDRRQPSTPRASAPRPAWRDWRCPSAFPGHRSSPGPHCFAAPFLPPQSEPSADACCAASRVVCA